MRLMEKLSSLWKVKIGRKQIKNQKECHQNQDGEIIKSSILMTINIFSYLIGFNLIIVVFKSSFFKKIIKDL